MTNSNSVKMAESSPYGKKTPWEKEKVLVTSNFSFSHSVFERLVLQTRKKPGLVWERVNSLISVVICSFFESGTVSRWCIREWVKADLLYCLQLPSAWAFVIW